MNAATGELVWMRQTLFELPVAPTVSGNMIYAGSYGGGLEALNAASGELLWQFPIDAAVHSSPIVADGLIYIGSSDGSVYAVRAPASHKQARQ